MNDELKRFLTDTRQFARNNGLDYARLLDYVANSENIPADPPVQFLRDSDRITILRDHVISLPLDYEFTGREIHQDCGIPWPARDKLFAYYLQRHADELGIVAISDEKRHGCQMYKKVGTLGAH